MKKLLWLLICSMVTSSVSSCSIGSTPNTAPVAVLHFSVDPASIDFGKVNSGVTSKLSLSAYNPTNSSLIIGEVSGLSMPFGISAGEDTCSMQTLPSGASCSITLRFGPISAQTFTADIQIPYSVSNGNQSFVDVSLSGVGADFTGADISVAKPFVTICPFNQSYLTLRNDGTSDLDISSIGITGPDAKMFTQASQCSAIKPGTTCQIPVSYNPTGTISGNEKANIDIYSNDPDENPLTISLIGAVCGAD
jgi:hypothetical protein